MKIPADIIAELEKEADLSFGRVCLEITLHDKHPRFKITREKSIIPGRPTSGEVNND
jgi:hypothetical protein